MVEGGQLSRMKLSNCINYLLTVSQHEVFLRFYTQLSPFGITPGQYGVLSVLWQSEAGVVAPKDISNVLRLETSTVSGVLDKMQKLGLVHRTLDENDRRSIRVELTEAGWALRDKVLEAIQELNQEVSSSFTPEEWESLCSFLKKLGRVEDVTM